MAGREIRAAVVGASTLLGKELVQEIGESAAAGWDLRLLDESDETEGQLTSAGDEALVIQPLSDTSFQGTDVVFFTGTRQAAAKHVDAALAAGAAIVDLTGELGDRPGFLMRSPWLQQQIRPDLTTVGIAAPHPGALMLAVVVGQITRQFELDLATATLLEPASAAGAAGVDELHQQTVSLLSFQEMPKQVYGAQIAFNVQGSPGEEAEIDFAATQKRVRHDLAQLLGADQQDKVRVRLLQAPVFHGYVASVYLQLREASTEQQVRSTLHGGMLVAEDATNPSNQAAVESGELLVSVESDGTDGRGYWLFAAADNLRFAARSGVAAAIELVALRPLARVQ